VGGGGVGVDATPVVPLIPAQGTAVKLD
jgi:hypothetical protein